MINSKFLKAILFLSLTLLLTNCKSNKIVVCGHRGAMGHETENTIPSIKKGLELQANMIEIDVFKIKTGELVVFHDDNLERITNGTGKIEALTFTELRELLVDGKYQIPTLQEVIETIDRHAVLNIELKGENTATDTHEIIEEYKKRGWKNDDFFISSFRINELEKMRSLDKDIVIGVLTYKDSVSDIINTAKKLNAQAINPYFKTLTAEQVAMFHKNNFKVYPWTVDDILEINKLKGFKVDGIITNYPERIKL